MRSALLLLLAPLALSAGCAATPPHPHPEAGPARVDAAGLALDGFDPVAYFPEGGGAPLPGDEARTASHAGAVYRFASEEHRALFVADPERYAPAYGGWCAWAMADGERVEVDPRSFLVEEGRLLLFYDGLFADTRARWLERGGTTLRPRADAQWARMRAAGE